ncbi:hypothetical protein RhiirA1_252264 [Rhizophagus irregularis]|nr:hypothetical protein RhiirA1_252264 [Rhizophagus irregularis]PKY15911.1 hypothetical protein RhiirB3_17558 [Rhizophagus irregularis]
MFLSFSPVLGNSWDVFVYSLFQERVYGLFEQVCGMFILFCFMTTLTLFFVLNIRLLRHVRSTSTQNCILRMTLGVSSILFFRKLLGMVLR